MIQIHALCHVHLILICATRSLPISLNVKFFLALIQAAALLLNLMFQNQI